MRPVHLAALAALALVAGCGGERDITLRDLRDNDRSPEEFSIVPPKPLEVPENLAALPQPTPGGANRTDQTPEADAVAALGGNPNATVARGAAVPGTDVALVQTAGRFGRDPAIRAQLAAEDEDFRRRNSRFTFSLAPRDDYALIYRRQTLDPYLWLERYRAAGARTPTAPPPAR